MDNSKVVILKGKNVKDTVELHCSSNVYEVTESGHLILDWGEILDKIKEYHNFN